MHLTDIFVSYSQKDLEFAEKFYQTLIENKYSVWADWVDIPMAAEWGDEIKTAIEAADQFVFIISPDSLNSQQCMSELAHAEQHNKCIVPVLLRECPPNSLPQSLYARRWINFREGDDFESAFQEFGTAIGQDHAHVRAHTWLLQKAIQWEQKNHDLLYLLGREELSEAEKWVEENKLPRPTPLQRFFIRACREFQAALPGDLNDVYISYSRMDKPFVEMLLPKLTKAGFKVWLDLNLEASVNWQEELPKRIEAADNFIFILSPDSLKSEICVHLELAHAVLHNKRLIPLSVRMLEKDDLTRKNLAQSLEQINWISFREEDDFDESFQKLNAVLKKDRTYVRKHTYYLVRALLWDKRDRHPSFLLRHDELKVAERWEHLDKSPTPTELVQTYIQKSYEYADEVNRRQKDVFISYKRTDKPFVRMLYEELEKNGHFAWVDWEDIAATAQWQKEINAGIEEADNFLFVVSPESAISPYCKMELDFAVQLNKRIFRVEFKTTPDIPAALGPIQWIDFEHESFERAIKMLVRALDTDHDYVAMHTRLLLRAKEWKQKKRSDSFLLRGEDLDDATQWLKLKAGSPTPTPLQRQYIKASKKKTETVDLEKSMLHELFQIIQDRRIHAHEGSYTASLFASGEDRIIQKVGEEAVEVIIAAKAENKQRIIEETADLFYHVLVMLEVKGITLEEVEEELRRRHKK